MPWHTNTVRPEPNQTAIIAVQLPSCETPWLMPELYYWCEQYGSWMSETNHLKLKHDVFWWQAESDLLGDLPC